MIAVTVTVGCSQVQVATDCNYSPDVLDDVLCRAAAAAAAAAVTLEQHGGDL